MRPATSEQTKPATGEEMHPADRVRRLLRLNASFSIVTGVTAAVLTGFTAEVLGIDLLWLVRAVGLALLGFAGLLILAAGQDDRMVAAAALPISIADFLWVLATPIVVALGWLSNTGAVVAALIAVAVAMLGGLQLSARRSALAVR